MFRAFPMLLALALLLPTLAANAGWYKGVTHVHSLWSDGDTAPEIIAAWYKDRDYDFMCFSEHHVLQEHDQFFPIKDEEKAYLKPADVAAIQARFGEDWVVLKEDEEEPGALRMRLKTHEELKAHFNEPGKFLMFPAEEITSIGGPHVNALNIREVIKSERGEVVKLIQKYIDQVREQRERYGVPMIAHVNHINFSDGVTSEELLQVEGLEFFEVYNGHPSVHNWGREEKGMPSTDRHWDIIQSLGMLTQPDYVLYGVSTDDSHNYKEFGVGKSNPGRGWIMVEAEALETDLLIQAMMNGRFYGTTGVLFKHVTADEKSLSFEIEAQEGVTYTTQFIGTRKGFDQESTPVLDADGNPLPRATRQYSDEIGMVLFETTDLAPRYEFQGDELYVRAKVVSDKLQENPFDHGDFETAWIQPVLVP